MMKGRKWGKRKRGCISSASNRQCWKPGTTYLLLWDQVPHKCTPHPINNWDLTWLKNLCKLSNFKLSQLLSLSLPCIVVMNCSPTFSVPIYNKNSISEGIELGLQIQAVLWNSWRKGKSSSFYFSLRQQATSVGTDFTGWITDSFEQSCRKCY